MEASEDDIAIIRKFNVNGITIISLGKYHFSARVFTLLVYQKQAISVDKFCNLLEYLLVANSVDVIAGEFNYHLSKVLSNKLVKYKSCQI